MSNGARRQPKHRLDPDYDGMSATGRVGIKSSPKSRKNRAIGLLTAKILAELPDHPDEGESWEMSIEQVVQRLGASRGSVYEVFHVLESILLVTKIGTNTYKWNGFGKLSQTLAFLRLIAIMLDVPGDMKRVRDHEIANLVKETKRKEDHISEWKGSKNPMMAGAPDGAFGLLDTSSRPQDESPNAQSPGKLHILRVCQKFVMLFLVAQQPKTMSLEFASKVIHGIHLPDSALKSRTRRLYDISNVLTSLRAPLMVKVNMTSLNSPRKTAIQYRGPDVELMELNAVEIMLLPDYRRKHLYFDHGKAVLGIPERPTRIPRLTTVRLRPVEDGIPRPVESMYGGLHLERMAIADLKKPFPLENIAKLEAMRLNTKLIKNKERQNSEEKEQRVFDTMWMAIIPGQETLLQCFEPQSPTEVNAYQDTIHKQPPPPPSQHEEFGDQGRVCSDENNNPAAAATPISIKTEDGIATVTFTMDHQLPPIEEIGSLKSTL